VFGAVVVHAEDNLEEAIVEVTPRDANSDVLARTTVQLRDSTLTVHGPKPRGGLFDLPLFAGSRSRIEDALDVVITVPSATPVRITTLSADVTLHGRVGAADIASGATCVEAEQVDGDLRVRCDSGPIRIGLVTGSAGQPALHHPDEQVISWVGPAGCRQRQADEVPGDGVLEDSGQEVIRHLSRISIPSSVASMPAGHIDARSWNR